MPTMRIPDTDPTESLALGVTVLGFRQYLAERLCCGHERLAALLNEHAVPAGVIDLFLDEDLASSDVLPEDLLAGNYEEGSIINAAVLACGLPRESLMASFGAFFLRWLVEQAGYQTCIRQVSDHLTGFARRLNQVTVQLYMALSNKRPRLPEASITQVSSTSFSLGLLLQEADATSEHIADWVSIYQGMIQWAASNLFDSDVTFSAVQTTQTSQSQIKQVCHVDFTQAGVFDITTPRRAKELSAARQRPPPSGVTLDPESFHDLFPFHFALDMEFRVIQAGEALKRVLPPLAQPGIHIGDVLTLMAPAVPWSMGCLNDILDNAQHVRVVLGSAAGMELCGGLHRVRQPCGFRPQHSHNDTASEECGALIFLGGPHFMDVDQMREAGLYLSDWPSHDLAVDQVFLGASRQVQTTEALQEAQTSNIALKETLAEALAAQQSQAERPRGPESQTWESAGHMLLRVLDSLLVGEEVSSQQVLAARQALLLHTGNSVWRPLDVDWEQLGNGDSEVALALAKMLGMAAASASQDGRELPDDDVSGSAPLWSEDNGKHFSFKDSPGNHRSLVTSRTLSLTAFRRKGSVRVGAANLSFHSHGSRAPVVMGNEVLDVGESDGMERERMCGGSTEQTAVKGASGAPSHTGGLSMIALRMHPGQDSMESIPQSSQQDAPSPSCVTWFKRVVAKSFCWGSNTPTRPHSSALADIRGNSTNKVFCVNSTVPTTASRATASAAAGGKAGPQLEKQGSATCSSSQVQLHRAPSSSNTLPSTSAQQQAAHGPRGSGSQQHALRGSILRVRSYTHGQNGTSQLQLARPPVSASHAQLPVSGPKSVNLSQAHQDMQLHMTSHSRPFLRPVHHPVLHQSIAQASTSPNFEPHRLCSSNLQPLHAPSGPVGVLPSQSQASGKPGQWPVTLQPAWNAPGGEHCQQQQQQQQQQPGASGDASPAQRIMHRSLTVNDATPRRNGQEALKLLMHPSDEVTAVLATIDEWQFDSFRLDQVSNGRPLSLLAFHLFVRMDLVKSLRLSANKLARFLSHVEDGYGNNPYHSSVHAADVLRSLHAVLTRGGVLAAISRRCRGVSSSEGASPKAGDADKGESPEDSRMRLFTVYLAAIIHDYQHRGVTNDFLIRSTDPLAVLYNDMSPLEMHHAAAAFTVMQQAEYAFIPSLGKQAQLRKNVIELVLGTDMKQHFALNSSFALKFAELRSPSGGVLGGTVDKDSRPGFKVKVGADGATLAERWDQEAEILTLKMAMKVADLGHLTSDTEVHKKWVARLEEEMFRQGDRERALSQPVSPLMDRHKSGITKSQCGFFTVVAKPMFQNFAQLFPSCKDLVTNLEHNFVMWKALEAMSSNAGPAT